MKYQEIYIVTEQPDLSTSQNMKYAYDSRQKAEEHFVRLLGEYGVEDKEQIDGFLDDGYWDDAQSYFEYTSLEVL